MYSTITVLSAIVAVVLTTPATPTVPCCYPLQYEGIHYAKIITEGLYLVLVCSLMSLDYSLYLYIYLYIYAYNFIIINLKYIPYNNYIIFIGNNLFKLEMRTTNTYIDYVNKIEFNKYYIESSVNYRYQGY